MFCSRSFSIGYNYVEARRATSWLNLEKYGVLQFLYRPCAAIVQRAQLGSNTPRPQPLALKSDAVRREADAIAAEPCR